MKCSILYLVPHITFCGKHLSVTFFAPVSYSEINIHFLSVKISMDEFQEKDIKGLIRFVARTKRSKPYTKSRNSNQTWLETDRNSVKTLQSLRQRYAILNN